MRKLRKIFIMTIIISVITLCFYWNVLEIFGLKTPSTTRNNTSNKICYVSFNDNRLHISKSSDIKMIYYITPTYPRPEQVPDLTRLSHTLMHVPRLHWIVADDQSECSELVVTILRRSGLPYTHLSTPKPSWVLYTKHNNPRGVSNRLGALDWLKDNGIDDGIMFFGDDDNTVDLLLFDEIRKTKRVSMFPVGLIGSYGVSSPIVQDGKIVGFFDSWSGSRTFPVDMAGFAVDLHELKPTTTMPFIAGHEEDRFLLSLELKLDDIEPLADNCTKILVWHTRTVKYKKPTLKIDVNKLNTINKYKNLVSLLNETTRLGMAKVSRENGSKASVIHQRKSYSITKI